MSDGKVVSLKNPNLDTMENDYLYHLNINIQDTHNTEDIRKRFGDVKVICLGGTTIRMRKLAELIKQSIRPNDPDELVDLCADTHRYAMFKVGPILCCSHGIGMASFSVLLHELFKLVKYAECIDPIFIRVGSCGGVGVDPGTVVVTKNAFNGYLRPEYEIAILGERVIRPAKFCEAVSDEIVSCQEPQDNFKIVLGNTMGTNCFYEGQGRLDGAICHYTDKDKLNFLNKCYELGIRNIEMEAPMFASLSMHLNIKAADVCVTFLNRLNGDQVSLTKDLKEDYEYRPLVVVTRYVNKILKK